jgi:very-short-patch-repair endonuclease
LAHDLIVRVSRDKSRRLLGFARQMRKQSTDAEIKVWSILRSRLLADYKFRRQYPIGGYVVDFYCVRCRLAVELDGGQHNDGTGKDRDERRSHGLQELGVRVVRFWDHDVLRHPEVIAQEILRQLEIEKPSP